MLEVVEKLNSFKVDVRINGSRATALVDTGALCSVISAAFAAKVGAVEAGVKATLWSGTTPGVCDLVSASLGLYTTQEFLLEKKVSLWRKSSYQPVLDLYDLTLGLNILDQFDFNINYRDRCLILMDAAHRVEYVTYIGGDQVATASPLYIGVRCVLNGVERKLVAFVDTGATVSMIHPSVVPNPLIKRKLPFMSDATNPFGQKESAMGTMTLPLVLGCVLGSNIAFEAKLYVFQDCGSQMVIGNDILERFSCRVTNQHVLFSKDDGGVLRVRYADLKD